MPFFMQLDSAGQIIDTAAAHGWESALLASLVLGGFGFLGWMLRQVLTDARLRESLWTKRLDAQEQEFSSSQRAYTASLVALSEKVVECVATSSEAQRDMNQTLQKVANVMDEVNGDIRELCSLMKVCPCLVIGMHRGEYRIVDKDGEPVNLTGNS